MPIIWVKVDSGIVTNVAVLLLAYILLASNLAIGIIKKNLARFLS